MKKTSKLLVLILCFSLLLPIKVLGYGESVYDLAETVNQCDKIGTIPTEYSCGDGGSGDCMQRQKCTSSTKGYYNDGTDPMTGSFGLYVKIIHYDYESGANEEMVGNAVLIGNDALFKDISVVTDNTSGASGGQTDMVQVCWGSSCDGQPGNVVRLTYDQYSYIQQQAKANLIQNVFNYENGVYTYPFSEADLNAALANMQEGNAQLAVTRCRKWDSQNFTQTISVYDSANIKYAPDGGNTTTNVKVIKVGSELQANKSMLYKYAVDYFNAKGAEFDYTDFGISKNGATAQDMVVNKDDYYMLFEPVVRRKGGLASSSTTSSTKSWTTGKELVQWVCNIAKPDCSGTGSTGVAGPRDSRPSSPCGFYVNRTCVYKKDEKGRIYGRPDIYDNMECSPGGNCGSEWRDGIWRISKCAGYLVTHTRTLVTTRNYMESTIIPARTTNYDKVMSKLNNEKGQTESRRRNEETNKVEYYVGPDLETALIGTEGTNKYKFDDSSVSYTADNAKKYTKGAFYIDLPRTIVVRDCLKECSGTAANTDERLKCAENYYDNYYKYEEGVNDATRIYKSEAIIECGYEKQQNNCEKKLTDGSFLESIMAGGSKAIGQKAYNYSSKCNASISGGEAIADYNYGYKAYCEASSLTPSDESAVHLDQEDFINVLCVERTSCGFSSLSGDRVTSGREITYGERAHLEKKCAVWYDNDSWKFYYASIPRNDAFEGQDEHAGQVYNTRERMVEIIDWYKKVVERSTGFSGPIGEAIAFDKSDVIWENLKYDKSKLTVNTTITEKYKENGSTAMKTSVTGPLTMEEDESQTKSNELEADTNGTNEAYSYARTVQTPKYYPTIFKTASEYDGYYRLPHKYCLALDKGATPVNWDNKSGNCDDGTPPRYSYFLKLNTYGVGFSSECKNTNYLYSKDDCVLGDFRCEVVIDTKSKGVCSPDDTYDVRLVLRSKTTNNARVTGYGLSETPNTINNKQELLGESIKEDKYYYGTVNITDSKNGNSTITCSNKSQVGKYGCDCIENGCTISRDGGYSGSANNKYRITGPAGETKIWLGGDASTYVTLYKEADGYSFYVDKALNVSINGRIDAGNVCYTCENSQNLDCVEEDLSCENKNDPRWLRDYCERSYKCDKHNFTTFEECYSYYDPGSKCPAYENIECRDGYYKLKSWCESNTETFCGGEDAVYQCIQRCMGSTTTCIQSDKYVYRPIDNNCPFPNSYLNIEGASEGCIDGERDVGTNWLGLDEKVITSKGNSVYNKEEYVIDLNPKTISKIRGNESDKDNYYQYKDARDYTDSQTSSQCHDGTFGSTIPYNGYCSEFVHSGYFSVVRGKKSEVTK